MAAARVPREFSRVGAAGPRLVTGYAANPQCDDAHDGRRASGYWPVWVQRCGIGSSCDCEPDDKAVGFERDIQRATAGSGTPLAPGPRARLERAFAADFSAVRVHTSPGAHEVASRLNAYAFTVGKDLVFGSGAYAPDTPGGDRLLAHELAHVVQQREGLASAAIDTGASDPLERAADAAAHRAVGTSQPMAGHAPGAREGRRSLAYELSRVVQRGDKTLLSSSAPGTAGTSARSPGQEGSGPGLSIQRQEPLALPRPMPLPPASPWAIPTGVPLPPVYFPEPRGEPEAESQGKRRVCDTPDLPYTLVSFFPESLGQGKRVKASPLTRCPGNTVGSKPQQRIYKDQFKCIAAAGQAGQWVRGHILHGETDRSGPRNLHGPGDTAANLIIIHNDLNQSMWSWIENVVLKLIYGPFPHVLWYNAWVDSYYPGLPFFAQSISIEYGPYIPLGPLGYGIEGTRWNFKQFPSSRIPPPCPAYGYAEGGLPFPGIHEAPSQIGFQSRLKICRSGGPADELESRDFDVTDGGLMAAIDAKFVSARHRPGAGGPRGTGHGEEAAGAQGQPEGCPVHNYHVTLWKVRHHWFDEEISRREVPSGQPVVLTWQQLEPGSYYMRIGTYANHPGCCLEGDITVSPFHAPRPRPAFIPGEIV